MHLADHFDGVSLAASKKKISGIVNCCLCFLSMAEAVAEENSGYRASALNAVSITADGFSWLTDAERPDIRAGKVKRSLFL